MKKVEESQVIMHELVLPNDTNILGNVLGGKVMHYMDICAAMSAYKHARSPVVTASVDRLDFLSPAKKGEILILRSSVNYTGSTSMEIGVKIETENPFSGRIRHTASAYLTFVSLGEDNRPKNIQQVLPGTEDQKRRFDDGKARYIQRKKQRK